MTVHLTEATRIYRSKFRPAIFKVLPQNPRSAKTVLENLSTGQKLTGWWRTLEEMPDWYHAFPWTDEQCAFERADRSWCPCAKPLCTRPDHDH